VADCPSFIAAVAPCDDANLGEVVRGLCPLTCGMCPTAAEPANAGNGRTPTLDNIPACIADQIEQAEQAGTADTLLCDSSIDTSACSADELASIDEMVSMTCGNGGHRLQEEAEDLDASDITMDKLSRVAHNVECPLATVSEVVDNLRMVCVCEDGSECQYTDGMPTVCTPICAIEVHAFTLDCQQWIQSMRSDISDGLAAFEQLCVSEETINVDSFIDSLAHAQCAAYAMGLFAPTRSHSVCFVGV
jgi:hypothetical protein